MLEDDEAAVSAEEDPESQEAIEDSENLENTEEEIAETPEPTAQELEAQEAEEKEKAKKLEKSRSQRRIDRLTKDKYELQARLDAQERYAKPAQEPAEEAELSEDEKLDRRLDAREAQRKEAAFFEKSQDLLDKALDEGDFDPDEIVNLPIGAANAIVDLDDHTLFVHLQENPEEISKLQKMSPSRQAAEMGLLQAKLSVKAPTKKSSAPAPIKTIGAKKDSSSQIDVTKMSPDEFDKWHDKQMNS